MKRAKSFTEFFALKCTKCGQLQEIRVDWEILLERYMAWKRENKIK